MDITNNNSRLPKYVEFQIIHYYLKYEPSDGHIIRDNNIYYHHSNTLKLTIKPMALVCWEWFYFVSNYYYLHQVQSIHFPLGYHPRNLELLNTLYNKCTNDNSIKYHIFQGKLPQHIRVKYNTTGYYESIHQSPMELQKKMKELLKHVKSLTIDHAIKEIVQCIPWNQIEEYTQEYFDQYYEDNIALVKLFVGVEKEKLSNIKRFDVTLLSDHFYDNFNLTIFKSICNLAKTKMTSLQSFGWSTESHAFAIEYKSFDKEVYKIMKETLPKHLVGDYDGDSSNDDDNDGSNDGSDDDNPSEEEYE